MLLFYRVQWGYGYRQGVEACHADLSCALGGVPLQPLSATSSSTDSKNESRGTFSTNSESVEGYAHFDDRSACDVFLSPSGRSWLRITDGCIVGRDLTAGRRSRSRIHTRVIAKDCALCHDGCPSFGRVMKRVAMRWQGSPFSFISPVRVENHVVTAGMGILFRPAVR